MTRDPLENTVIPADPLRRFLELDEALSADSTWWDNRSSLRFAAVTALTCPGEPSQVAAAIRAKAQEIKDGAGWFGELNSPLAFLLAAMMVQHGDSPLAFGEEVDRTRKLLRAEQLRRGGIYETMAIWVLRLQADLRPIRRETIRRFKAIYEQMKRYHWWLTGPDDFPACAVLCGQDATPRTIGEGVEALYQALRQNGAKRGDPLQTAANLLYLAHGEPDAIAARFAGLAEGFRAEGVRILQTDYDELAILCLVPAPTSRVVRTVLTCREPIHALKPRPGHDLSFNLACSVGFLALFGDGGAANGVQVADVKALVDMQAILAAQQAAAAAAASSAAAASAAT